MAGSQSITSHPLAEQKILLHVLNIIYNFHSLKFPVHTTFIISIGMLKYLPVFPIFFFRLQGHSAHSLLTSLANSLSFVSPVIKPILFLILLLFTFMALNTHNLRQFSFIGCFLYSNFKC